MNIKEALLLVAVAGFATGCFATKMAQTAEPLGDGNNELALSFNTSQFANLTEGGNGASATLPNLIPNFHWGVGIGDDMDLYGSVNFVGWYTELGLKYVPLQTENGNLAVAPLVGLSPLGALASLRLAVPVLYTHKLNNKTSLTVMGEGVYRRRGNASSGDWSDDAVDAFSGDTLGVGGGIGLEVKGRAFFVRPSLNYTYYTASFTGADDPLDIGIGQLGFTFGRVGGKVEAQLDRIEEKLDALSE